MEKFQLICSSFALGGTIVGLAVFYLCNRAKVKALAAATTKAATTVELKVTADASQAHAAIDAFHEKAKALMATLETVVAKVEKAV
jgi:hypothetical protein